VNGKSGLTASLHITDNKLKETFKNAWAAGKKDLLGFSIDAQGDVMPGTADGKSGRIATALRKVNSLDVVSHPAAGGKLLRLVASKQGGQNKMGKKEEVKLEEARKERMEKIAAMIRDNPSLIEVKEGFDIEKATDEQLFEAFAETMATKTSEKEDSKTEGEKPKEDTAKEDDQKKEEIKEAMMNVDSRQIAHCLESIKYGNYGRAVDALSEMMKLYYGKPYTPEGGMRESAPKLNSDEQFGKNAMDRVQKFESAAMLKDRLAESKLPDPVKDKIRNQFADKIFTEAELDACIDAEKGVLAKLSESGLVTGMGEDKTTVGDNEGDRMEKALDLLVDPRLANDEELKESYEDVPKFDGLKEAYIRWTGDKEITGRKDQRLTEAATTSDFTYALGTSMNRRLARAYKRLQTKAVWGKFARVTGVRDFKQYEIIRIGGFGNLSTVAESAAYTELTTPSEVRATYTPTKRGNIFVVTREMIKNDDLRFIRVFPEEMARAADRTLARFVFDLLTNAGASSGAINTGTIYDGYALYDATNHSNLVSTALSYTAIDAGITAMVNQAQADSSEPLGIMPKYLIVPHELRAAAKIAVDSEAIRDFTDAANGTPKNNPVYKAVEVLAVPNYYLGTDTNNWYLVADPNDVGETIEIGFVDNKQTPEILVQDAETVGTVFTNDRITYKVRHEYSGAVADFRGFYAGIVA
jgi:hypothetical protein